MKTTIITAILTLLATLPMKGSPLFSVMEVEDKKDIKLEGDSEDEREKSLTRPFGAYQEDNQRICVISYDAHSSATICVMDSCGETVDVYSSSLSSLQVIPFNISNYANGIYTLIITTPQGIYLTGTFEIE